MNRRNFLTSLALTPVGVQPTLFGPPSVIGPLPHLDGLILSTGSLAPAFESIRTKQPVATPGLAITYRAPATPFLQTA